MGERGLERRLVALLVGDAHGFTKQMHADEDATIALLDDCRKEVHGRVSAARGRVLDDRGDGFLAEFPSALDAVRCALELHATLASVSTPRSGEARLAWKMGVHLGEIVAQGDRVFGDGVNIAFHLPNRAVPGGLVVSGAVFEQIEHRFDRPMRAVALQHFRGSTRIVPVYAVETGFEMEDPQNPPAERRLLAVLVADIFGYSRMMASDLEATLRAVREYRDAIRRAVEVHRGVIADFTGDNFLASFPTALEAVQGGIAIQDELNTRNADRPPEERVTFRIGAHLGDVRTEGGNLYGNAINIAARLESISEPGQMCISSIVREQLRGTLQVELEDIGEHTVKNIADPVRVFRVLTAGSRALD